MTMRSLLLAAALLAASAATAFAQSSEDVIATPALRASVTVSSDVVRIGDILDNAGTAALIAIYRAPDLGTTGSLPTEKVLAALQAHQVIGVDTRDIKSISVTRLSRPLPAKEIQLQVGRALEHRSGLGDAANIALTFDRDVRDIQLEASNTGALQPALDPVRPAQRPLRCQLRNQQRGRHRANDIALYRHRDRNRGSRRADAGRRTQRSPEIFRRDCPAPSARRGRRRRRVSPSRGRNADAQAASRRPGVKGLRYRQAGSGAARRQCHPDLRIHRSLSHHSRQGDGKRHRRRRRSTCSICNRSARCPAS